MGENSIRERLILSDVGILEALEVITTVERKLPTYKDLKNFALTQMPVAAVVGGIPIPTNHICTRTGQVDKIISKLRVDIYVYQQEYSNTDSRISFMLDDLWPALYNNPTRDNLCLITTLEAEEHVETWTPFVAFKISCFHDYNHSTEGI